MTRDDEDEDDEDNDTGFGRGQGPGFHFGFGPDGRNFDEGFTGLFQEMDELFRGMGSWEMPVKQFEYPTIGLQPHPGGSADGSRRTPRDWMLKEPGRDHPERRGDTDRVPEPEGSPGDRPSQDGPSVGPLTPYRRPWNPSRTFEEMWKNLSQREAVKEDKDLDSRVSSEGLDKILKPSTPDSKPFFQSVSVSKVVLPRRERESECVREQTT
ncbi:HCLS1-associated protein X-1 [Scyliorhinus torazame]